MRSPISRHLVPDGPPALPAGSLELRHALVRGLPDSVALDRELTLVFQLPTGNARLWHALEAATVIASSADDLAPQPPYVMALDPTARAPLRLLVRRAGTLVGVVPLVSGLRRRLPEAGATEPGAVAAAAWQGTLDIMVLDYRIHAGTACRGGDFGSYVRLGWRRPDRSTNPFELPPLAPRVAERFLGQVQSQLGTAPSGGPGNV